MIVFSTLMSWLINVNKNSMRFDFDVDVEKREFV